MERWRLPGRVNAELQAMSWRYISSKFTMIPEYIICQGISMPNNTVGNYVLCNFLATQFLCCCIFLRKDIIISQFEGGGLVTFVDKKWISWLSDLNGWFWWLGYLFGSGRVLYYYFGTEWMPQVFYHGKFIRSLFCDII